MNALDITCGAELGKFQPQYINGRPILTGYENIKGICGWCGKQLTGRQRLWCPGHGEIYHEHFDWNWASSAALDRAQHRCENCGAIEKRSKNWLINLQVHHIVPLNGGMRWLSAYNLPFNLMVLCHDCHVGPEGIHAAMKFEYTQGKML